MLQATSMVGSYLKYVNKSYGIENRKFVTIYNDDLKKKNFHKLLILSGLPAVQCNFFLTVPIYT